MISAKHQPIFVKAVKKTLIEYYGEDPSLSKDYARIIDQNHHARLTNLLTRQTSSNKSTKVEISGKSDINDLYIPPIVLSGVGKEVATNPIMDSEIFGIGSIFSFCLSPFIGPLLPIIEIADVQEAFQYVGSRDKPLALYLFTNKKSIINDTLVKTYSGGIVFNDVFMHFTEPALPFGGVGASGIGAYHGKKSFDIFTHEKSCMIRDIGNEFANNIRYPPYTPTKLNIMSWVLTKKPKGFVRLFLAKLFR